MAWDIDDFLILGRKALGEGVGLKYPIILESSDQ
jgi:hypothetical protein